MPTLLIAYDLAVADRGERVADAIKALGDEWARPLASVWYLRTDATAAVVEQVLAELLDLDDGLVVQPVVGVPALANTVVRWWTTVPTEGEGEDERRPEGHGDAAAQAPQVLPWRRTAA